MKKGLTGAAVFSPLLLATAISATAQDSPSGTSSALEVITVTAQKREQQITDVPMALSAYDGEFLEEIGGTDLSKVSAITPGFVIQLQDKFAPGFSIRGITSNDFSAQSELRVAVFQDGVAVTQAPASYGELFDIDRVEVEKGPQSTLHGRSALNGGVSIFHNLPTDEFSAEFKGGIGDYNYRHAQGVVNIPVSDTLAIRFGALTRERDGFIEDLRSTETFNALNAEAYRFSTSWSPTDDFNFDLVATYDVDDTKGGVPFKSGTFLPLDQETGDVIGDLDPNSPTSLSTFGKMKDAYFYREIKGVSGTAEYTINDQWSLTSISGYRWFDACQTGDNDGTPTNLIAYEQCNSGEQLSEELRFNFTGLGIFDGFFGVSAFKASNELSMLMGFDERAMALLLGGQLQSFAPNGLTNDQINDILGGNANFLKAFHADHMVNQADIETYDAFADVTASLTDKLQLFLGGRVTWDDKEVSTQGFTPYGNSSLTGAGLFIQPTPDNAKLTDDNQSQTVTGRVGIRYDINDNLNWYAVYGVGKRPEVLNLNSAGISEIVPAEKLASIETGLKFNLLDGRLVGDSSVYYYEYENFQTTATIDGSLTTINAGEADATGFEFQANYLFSEQLTVFGNYGYNKARLRTGAYEGNQFRNSPDHKFSVGANIQWPVMGGTLAFVPVYTWQSEMFFFDDNDQPELQQRTPAAYSDNIVDEFQESFGLLSATLSYTGASENWSLSLIGDNLTDEKYIVDAGNTGDSFGIPTFIGGAHRTVRAEINVSF